MPKVELWVADDDGSDRSRAFVAELRKLSMLAVRPKEGAEPVAASVLRQKVADGDEHHALLIGTGFGAAILAGRKPPLVLVRDPGRELEQQMVQIGLMQAFMAVTEGRLWPVAMGEMLQKQGMAQANAARVVAAAETMQGLLRRFRGGSDPAGAPATPADPAQTTPAEFDFRQFLGSMVPLSTEDLKPPARPKSLSYQIAQSVAGMTVMMLMFGLVACSTTLLREREQGTLRRLLVTQAPRAAIPLGKFLFTFAVGMLQLAVLFAYGELVFAVGTFRDPATLLVLSVVWSLCATSFGMLIATWAGSQKQAEGLSTMLILVMAALGGCWFPIQMVDLPWYGEVATKSTLTYWAMTGFQGMFWRQQPFTHPGMLFAIGVQLAFAVVAAWLSLWLFRRRFLAR
jgi:ABC-type multidrug transport system permease subunit